MIGLRQQLFVLFCILMSFHTLVSSVALAENVPTKVVLGTATKGGGFQLFGSHLSEVINAVDSSLKVEAIATKGSKQNLPFGAG